jgi:hypothetical protein
MKPCKKCVVIKPFNEYHIDKKSADGYKSYCKCCAKEINQKWKKENPEKVKEDKKLYYAKNSEKIKESVRLWRIENRESFNLKKQKYIKLKRQSDPLFKLRQSVSNRTRSAFKSKRWNKNSKTKEILGADYQTVFNHIESRFENGMSWNNHGEWHIDHIVPLSVAKDEIELIKLCHYTNLQPLWAKENISKGSKIIACKL